MHGHKRFTMATDIQVYFCDLRTPLRRGSNKNTNLSAQEIPAERHRYLGLLKGQTQRDRVTVE